MDKKVNQKSCEHPERLKGKPGECASEQIKKCHGDISDKSHPCDSEKKLDKSV